MIEKDELDRLTDSELQDRIDADSGTEWRDLSIQALIRELDNASDIVSLGEFNTEARIRSVDDLAENGPHLIQAGLKALKGLVSDVVGFGQGVAECRDTDGMAVAAGDLHILLRHYHDMVSTQARARRLQRLGRAT